MSEPPLVFLDANVLFSAAIGGPAFELLIALTDERVVSLATSRACVAEAEVNLERKRPTSLDALADILVRVSVVTDQGNDDVRWASELLHPDDVHVLAAARRAGADVLLTGDTTHFGLLMERDDLGLRVRTPRAFLLDAV